MRPLLDADRLAGSSVVANCAMNRERGLAGSNGYGRELGFDVADFVEARLRQQDTVRWLDLCCGSGRALSEAAGAISRLHVTGVDLVDHFAVPATPNLRLVTASVADWQPGERYDLVTCVHGLHYIGDKLGLLAAIPGWLADDGVFAGNFDVASVRVDGGPRRLTAELRAAGFSYDARKRRLRYQGAGSVHLPFRFVGADDKAGPNYTGQPAVDAYYEPC